MQRLNWLAIPSVLAASLCLASLASAQRDDGPVRAAEAKAEGDIGANVNAQDSRAEVRGNFEADGNNVGADDRRERRVDRRDDRRDGDRFDDRREGTRTADSRYRFHQGRWWYQTSSGWMYWDNGRWVRFQSGGRTYSQAAAPRYYNNSGYYSNNGYYSQPYYNDGYYNRGYGRGYYGNGYYNGYYGAGYRGMPYGYDGPGHGNRGWGNMNYGSRGANRGSNIGGMIDQGFGGSGRAGAAIGGAIAR